MRVNVNAKYNVDSRVRWMDGSFFDLSPEAITAEVQEYWAELFKINKFFNQLQKRELLEKRKETLKKRRENDGGHIEAEKMPAIHVCNRIIRDIKAFKVTHILPFPPTQSNTSIQILLEGTIYENYVYQYILKLFVFELVV